MCRTPSAMSCSSKARLPVSRDTHRAYQSPLPLGRVAHMVLYDSHRRFSNLMLWLLVVLLLVLWLGGFTLNVAGGLIHLLLVVAVIVAIYNLIASRGRAV